jgi:hypothetical protein
MPLGAQFARVLLLFSAAEPSTVPLPTLYDPPPCAVFVGKKLCVGIYANMSRSSKKTVRLAQLPTYVSAKFTISEPLTAVAQVSFIPGIAVEHVFSKKLLCCA